MFAIPQPKARAARAGGAAPFGKRLNDENARAGARTKSVKDVKDMGGAATAGAGGPLECGVEATGATKKRAALGDVSNVHLSRPNGQQPGTKNGLPAGPRVTRSMAAATAKTRKPSASAVADAKAKTAAAAAAAVSRATKRTQAAIEAVAAESRAVLASDAVPTESSADATVKTEAAAAKSKTAPMAKSRVLKESKEVANANNSVFSAPSSTNENAKPNHPRASSKSSVVTTAFVATANPAKSDVSASTVAAVTTSVVPTVPTDSVQEQIYEEEDSQERLHMSKRVKTVEWDDLDAEDVTDPLMVSEYVNEIFAYMRELEMQTMPNPEYMELQKELQWKMRCILVDWLIEVHHKFHLLAETLYLSVNIVDRFLSMRVVSLVKLQLVGVTAMFIAAKYEEVVAPSIQNFLYMADGGYTDDEVLRAERYILQVIDFALQYPSPMSFLRRCSKADQYDIQTRTLAKYLMEVSLVDHRFLKMPPSMIAAAGLYLSRHMLSRGPWNANLAHYSGYEEAELIDCAQLVLDYLSKPLKYEALYKKYSARKFMKAAIYVDDWIAKRNGDLTLPFVAELSVESASEPVPASSAVNTSAASSQSSNKTVVKRNAEVVTETSDESAPQPKDDAPLSSSS